MRSKSSFETVLKLDPDDHVAALHLESCIALERGEAFLDAQGASVLKEKH